MGILISRVNITITAIIVLFFDYGYCHGILVLRIIRSITIVNGNYPDRGQPVYAEPTIVVSKSPDSASPLARRYLYL